ncbi:hypothetical protein KBD61_02255 [Patescibacteria group bacterium]|nr:hypothetical protein [Patescibacteria group bacterium]
MSEKFFRNEPATSWSKHAALEAEGRRLDEAARERKKVEATRARREAVKRAKRERTQALEGQKAQKEELAPTVPSLPHEPPPSSPPLYEKYTSKSIPLDPALENDDSRGSEYEALPKQRGSHRAVYELQYSKGDMAQVGSRSKQRDYRDRDVLESRHKKDIALDRRRGPSIRDLKEIPHYARIKPSEEDQSFLEESSKKIAEARQMEERKAKNLAVKHVKKNQWERTKDRAWVEERLKDPIYEGRDERRLRAYQDSLARSYGVDADAGKALDEDARNLAEESGQSLRTTRDWVVGKHLNDKSREEEEREERVQEAWKKAISRRNLQEEQEAEQRIVTRPEKIGMGRHNQASRKEFSRAEENVLNYGHSHMGKASFHRSPNIRDYVADNKVTILKKPGLIQEKASYRSPDRGRVDTSRQQEQPRRSFWKGMSERFRRFFS